jgi:hypothetical protein
MVLSNETFVSTATPAALFHDQSEADMLKYYDNYQVTEPEGLRAWQKRIIHDIIGRKSYHVSLEEIPGRRNSKTSGNSRRLL